MTTVRLNDEIDTKLSTLIEIEKLTKSEIIKRAILEYYEKHMNKKTPYELGSELFGRFGSNDELSTTYKNKIREKLNEKHSH